MASAALDALRRSTYLQNRAPCRGGADGCRNCGTMPTGRKLAYCSDDCRSEFEADHFWTTARSVAVRNASVFDVESLEHMEYDQDLGFYVSHRRLVTFCAHCDHAIEDTPEINHVAPVNGNRRHFGCEHHQENLEALHHQCHVRVTNEQRAAGLIGSPPPRPRAVPPRAVPPLTDPRPVMDTSAQLPLMIR